MTPTLPHCVWVAAPRGGALRLRSGKASPAAPVWFKSDSANIRSAR